MGISIKLKSLIYLLTILLIIIIIPIGCDRDSNPLSVDEGQWISDIPFTYSILGNEYTKPHDNRIYESTNFLIFSDASSDDVKKKISKMAETSLRPFRIWDLFHKLKII